MPNVSTRFRYLKRSVGFFVKWSPFMALQYSSNEPNSSAVILCWQLSSISPLQSSKPNTHAICNNTPIILYCMIQYSVVVKFIVDRRNMHFHKSLTKLLPNLISQQVNFLGGGGGGGHAPIPPRWSMLHLLV